MASRAPPEEQPKLLEAALQVVKVQAHQMKRCLDKTKLMEALKHASAMLAELRTSNLAPKSYYELYMAVIDELRHFQLFLQDEYEKTDKMPELYELVQYAANIVPRLYLMITVGTVYMKSKPDMRNEILMDLVEMTRGVQHPLRGLFLRNYLLQVTKPYLADTAAEDVAGAGTINDSVAFILLNFAEMNKLWVRMQHQGHSREREKRERERKDLRILVGTNLVRLSQLDAIDVNLYAEVVLPGLMEQVVNCRDTIAQEYLMECIIQVFPDEYHLRTLHMLLEGCAVLQPTVSVKNILNALIDRLAAYAARDDARIPEDVRLFDIFSHHVEEVINARTTMDAAEVVALEGSLVNLALKSFPDNSEYVDKLLDFIYKILTSRGVQSVDSEPACAKELMKVAKIPINHYPSVLTVLDLPSYPALWTLLGYENRKAMARYLLNKVIEAREEIDAPDYVAALFDLISPLIADQEDQPEPIDRSKQDDQDFVNDQGLVGKLVRLIRSDTPDLQYQLLVAVRKHFGIGGEVRIKYTLPPLVIMALELARTYAEIADQDELWEKKAQKVFQYVHQTTSALAKADYPALALRLFLQCALAADNMRFEAIAYEFFTRALLVYEEDISGSTEQVQAITIMIGTLERTRCFSDENYDTLATKLALHSSRMLRKPDQARLVAMCSHLFWSAKTLETAGAERHEGKRVMECLQKALRVADNCMEGGQNVALFVDLLNKYLYYRAQGCDLVLPKYITGLVDVIRSNMDSVDDAQRESLDKYLRNTLKVVDAEEAEQEADPVTDAE